MTTSTQAQPRVAASSEEKYPAIADHGLNGDLQTAALVDTHGVIDWWWVLAAVGALAAGGLWMWIAYLMGR